jgi:anti-sigma regulatory factor (Ser/Thr protein kinase)
MEDLSLHILDIAENAVNAEATRIDITLCEDDDTDLLTLEIEDNGKGMDSHALERVSDPFFTTRTTRRIGLGLPLLDEAVRMANGSLNVASRVGGGTKVRATFQLSHIDRKPLGRIAETLVALIAGYPQIDISYRHERGDLSVEFSTEEARRRLDGVPLNSSESLRFIREYLTQRETSLEQHAQGTTHGCTHD